eukprot:TRINITY_DN3919_c0_g2_i2.p1 TRINITY_DN3919_c0_g2~~TRINITY_DN3919_c0_g2_i2.p1  ORF type:complete len:956 (+),score=198.92 TRINITY_DN3919_c0_g2_i2:84-2951(+)
MDRHQKLQQQQEVIAHELFQFGYVHIPGAVSKELCASARKLVNQALSVGLISSSDDCSVGLTVSVSENRLSTGKLIYNASFDRAQAIYDLLNCSNLFHFDQSSKQYIAAVDGGCCLGFLNSKFHLLQEAQIALRMPLLDQLSSSNAEELPGDHWHIDGQWESNIPQFSLIIGVYLSPIVAQGQGALTVFPGSHQQVKEWISENEDAKEKFCGQLRTKVAPKLNVDKFPPVEVLVDIGDVVLMHPLLAHRAGPNVSPDIRYAVYFRLCTHSFGPQMQSLYVRDLWCDIPAISTSAKIRARSYPKRIALITGANRGIGLEVAKLLLKTSKIPTHVIACFRRSQTEQTILEELSAVKSLNQNSSFTSLQLDVTNVVSCFSCVQTVLREFGRIHVLINNAAIVPRRSSGNDPVSEFEVLQTNFHGLCRMCLLFENLISHEGSEGIIINVTSLAGLSFLDSVGFDSKLHKTISQICKLSDLIMLNRLIHEKDEILASVNAYCLSKFGVNVFSIILSRMLSKVSVVMVDPGKCQSAAPSIMDPFSHSVVEGAKRIVNICFRCFEERGSGGFWWNTRSFRHPWLNSLCIPSTRRLPWIALCGVGGCGKRIVNICFRCFEERGSGGFWWNTRSFRHPWLNSLCIPSTRRLPWIALCGVGGCGKTTFMKKYAEEWMQKFGPTLICSELSEIDYKFCDGSRDRYLQSSATEKQQLHEQGLNWLLSEQFARECPVLFATHGSVMIKGKPTVIMPNDRAVNHFTTIIYLDYHLDQLSEIDYKFCDGSRDRYLQSSATEKQQLHEQGLNWLLSEQFARECPVLFATHGSVMIKGKPTVIMPNDRAVNHFTTIIYLDYHLDTVLSRHQKDQAKHRNVDKATLEEWLELERQTIQQVADMHLIHLVVVHEGDNLSSLIDSLLRDYQTCPNPPLTPSKRKQATTDQANSSEGSSRRIRGSDLREDLVSWEK